MFMIEQSIGIAAHFFPFLLRWLNPGSRRKGQAKYIICVCIQICSRLYVVLTCWSSSSGNKRAREHQQTNELLANVAFLLNEGLFRHAAAPMVEKIKEYMRGEINEKDVLNYIEFPDDPDDPTYSKTFFQGGKLKR
jgi:hypothetical protein